MKFLKKFKKQKKAESNPETLGDIKISKSGSCSLTFCGCFSFALGFLAGQSCSRNHSCDDDECCFDHGYFCIDDCLYVDCCHDDCCC
jgi:hypothetical protein